MCPPYYEMIRSHNPSFDLRYRMVQAALQQGIRAASRSFQCSRNTVRQWLRRYQEEGKPGLQERSRAPHRIPHKTPPEMEQAVLDAQDTIPCFGPQFGRAKDRVAAFRARPDRRQRPVGSGRLPGADSIQLAAPPVHSPHGSGGRPMAGLQRGQRLHLRPAVRRPSAGSCDVEAIYGILEPGLYELERCRASVRAFLNQAYSTSFNSTCCAGIPA